MAARPIGSKSGKPTFGEYRRAVDEAEIALTAVTPQLTGEPLEIVSDVINVFFGLLQRDGRR